MVYPNVEGNRSRTTAGISTIAQYLSTHTAVAARVILTGLGLPSRMKSSIKDGTVKAIELRNPSNPRHHAG